MARITKTQKYLELSPQQFNALNEKQMRDVVRTLAKTANQRISEFQKRDGVLPRRISKELESGGKFTTRGKNLNQLRAEYARSKNFLQSKTTTVTGYKQTINKTLKELAKKGVDITQTQLEKFFKAYDKLSEIDPTLSSKNMKYKVMGEISNIMENSKDVNVDAIVQDVYDKITEIYETNESVYNDAGFSQYF